jgi:hypothetical protein
LERGEIVVILDFQTNHLITVERLDPTLWRIMGRTEDNVFCAEVVLDVKLPMLDIRHAELKIRRDVMGIAPDLTAAEGKLIGVRVGQGMTKIVRGLIGGPAGSDRVAGLVLEAMEMLVNAFTLPELKKAMETAGQPFHWNEEGFKVSLADVVVGDAAVRTMAANPRLKDSCIAFRDL